MSWRFRRRFTVIPGVRLDLSKSGISTSIGRPATINLRGNRVKTTIGVPGSGISYQIQGRGKGHYAGMLLLIVSGLLLMWVLR